VQNKILISMQKYSCQPQINSRRHTCNSILDTDMEELRRQSHIYCWNTAHIS